MIHIQNIQAKYHKSPSKISKYESAYVIKKPGCIFGYALGNGLSGFDVESSIRFYNLDNMKLNWEIYQVKRHYITMSENNFAFRQISKKRLREVLNKTLNK
jgi:hypothetical protein